MAAGLLRHIVRVATNRQAAATVSDGATVAIDVATTQPERECRLPFATFTLATQQVGAHTRGARREGATPRQPRHGPPGVLLPECWASQPPGWTTSRRGRRRRRRLSVRDEFTRPPSSGAAPTNHSPASH